MSKIKHAAKSLKTFQGIHFETCLDDGETAEQMNKWLLEVSWEVANKGKNLGNYSFLISIIEC